MDKNMVYKKSFDDACKNDETKLFHDSNERNRDCAAAIDREIAACRYDGDHYDAATAAKNILAEYGADRVCWVLAGVIQKQHYDGRYSAANKKWAQAFPIPAEGTKVYLQSHPVLVDYFTSKTREQVTALNQKLQQAADYMVWEGAQNTTQGNWIMGFGDLPPELGGAAFIAEHQKEILALLEQNTDVVADAEIIDGSFDVCYCLAYCPNAEIHDGDEVSAPDKVHGYSVDESVLFPSNRGFALAENPNAPQPFVTWQYTEENGQRDYYWGHYFQDRGAAFADYEARAAEHRRDHGPLSRNDELEAPKPSILARLQEGKAAAAQTENTTKTAPKRDSDREVL